jgi:hypothetical protein
MSATEATRRQRQRVLSNYLNEQEAAAQLHKTVRALRAWRQQGIGPAWTKIGKSVFYRISAIESWLASLEQGGRS